MEVFRLCIIKSFIFKHTDTKPSFPHNVRSVSLNAQRPVSNHPKIQYPSKRWIKPQNICTYLEDKILKQ